MVRSCQLEYPEMSNSQYINRYPYWEFVIFVPVLYCRAWANGLQKRLQMAHLPESKSAAIAAIVSGVPMHKVATNTGIPRRTLTRWLADLPEYPGNDRMLAYLWRAFSEGGGISREQMRAGTLLERMLKHDGSDYPDTDALDDLVGE